ncbi:hypothetical protein LGQ02_03010 [Bacillus shivajii]|uniref:hypothetical protein n=1 Tax=Bacillus shivajii TaxID=1983719 RepID=UPI001CF9BA88|nr:hypothetical protein [Bacillus shivajii]UCZ53772.1 hypothetical protein LGQ02_03010 [Bacillus shivajii]
MYDRIVKVTFIVIFLLTSTFQLTERMTLATDTTRNQIELTTLKESNLYDLGWEHFIQEKSIASRNGIVGNSSTVQAQSIVLGEDVFKSSVIEFRSLFNWKNFQSCVVNDLSFNWTVLSTLGVLCGAACAGSGGWLCAPCIYITASIKGANWGWCIGKATS